MKKLIYLFVLMMLSVSVFAVNLAKDYTTDKKDGWGVYITSKHERSFYTEAQIVAMLNDAYQHNCNYFKKTKPVRQNVVLTYKGDVQFSSSIQYWPTTTTQYKRVIVDGKVIPYNFKVCKVK